jgi:hypothetical protein
VIFFSRAHLPLWPSKSHFSLTLCQRAELLTESSIVFVHGLCGHWRKTWTKDGVCWPKELLSKEDKLSHTRVLTFGYDANVINIMGQVSLNSLFDHSINLLHDLNRERKRDVVSLV